MLALALLAPFLGASLSLATGLLGQAYAARSALGWVGLSLAASAALAYEAVAAGALPHLDGPRLPHVGGGVLDLGFSVTPASAVLLLAVASVSLAVHLYSLWYLDGDPALAQYFGYISLFTGMMGVTAAGASLATLFVGWEGIGVASYLLVAFWSTRVAALSSALQAFLLNRAGDLALTLALALALALYGGTAFASLGLGLGGSEALALALLAAAAGKSAQLGLHAWLPNAMEAPTPVSALIHAATLVTAGVFLLVRCAPALLGSGLAPAAALLGALTTLFAGVAGYGQSDLKRVVAFSTCSQIALVLLAVGSGQTASGMALLALHAAYKAALFLGAGLAIHALGGLQDLRGMGGVGAVAPFTAGAMLLAAASLCALPYTSGEFGKDLLIAGVGGRGLLLGNLLWALSVGSVGLTLAYSVRLHRLAFGGSPRASLSLLLGAVEAGGGGLHRAVLLALGALLGLGLLGGYLLSGVFLPVGDLFPESLPTLRVLDDELSAGAPVSLGPYLAGLGGALLGYWGPSSRGLAPSAVSGGLALGSALYSGGLRVAGYTALLLDRGLFEAAGPYGLSGLLAGGAVRAARRVAPSGGLSLATGVALSVLLPVGGALLVASLAPSGGPLLLPLGGMWADAPTPWALGLGDGAPVAPEGTSRLYSPVVSFRVATGAAVVCFHPAPCALLALAPFPPLLTPLSPGRGEASGLPVSQKLASQLYAFTPALGRILEAMHARVGFAQAVLDFLGARTTGKGTSFYISNQLPCLCPLVYALGLLAGAPTPVLRFLPGKGALRLYFPGGALHSYLEGVLGCTVRTEGVGAGERASLLQRQDQARLGTLWRSGGRDP